ncbi:hypothetical protein A2U01_0116551, partial [Trifolium medium]|nr:hypothetical protein [Trifolium medium]
RALCEEFASHFTAQKWKPKMVASLNAINQGMKDKLREYAERFPKRLSK